jgi:hypothetical protein
MTHLRLAEYRRRGGHDGQLEAMYLVHLVVRWVFDVIAAALAVWLLVLSVALLAWAVWGLAWLVRRPCRARTLPEQQRSTGVDGDGDG